MDRRTLALWLCVAAAPGCGGGGGGGGELPPPEPLAFHGEYTFAMIGGRHVPAADVFSSVGQCTSDGQSQLAMQFSFTNANGTVAAALPVDATFTLDADGVLAIDLGGGNELTGQVSRDGALAVLTSTGAGNTPMLFLAVRPSGAYDATDLAGTYFVGLARASGTPEIAARFGTLVFDGAGGVPSIGSLVTNTNGSIVVSPGTSDTGTYAVFADGSFSYSGALGTFLGGLLEGGSVGLLAGSSGGQPALMVVVRQSGVLAAAPFSGRYGTGRFHFTGATGIDFVVLGGESVADGAGALSSPDLFANREGGLGSGLTRDATYVDEPSGRLSLAHVASTGAQALSGTGARDAAARFAFCVGNNNPGDPPALEVFVRR